MQIIENFKIEKIGLRYVGHYKYVSVHLSAKDFGADIPINRVSEFCCLCTDVNWEDGKYIDVLNGTYMRRIVEDNKVVGFKHIINDKTYWIDEERKNNNERNR